jgi:hypothetical protein
MAENIELTDGRCQPSHSIDPIRAARHQQTDRMCHLSLGGAAIWMPRQDLQNGYLKTQNATLRISNYYGSVVCVTALVYVYESV